MDRLREQTQQVANHVLVVLVVRAMALLGWPLLIFFAVEFWAMQKDVNQLVTRHDAELQLHSYQIDLMFQRCAEVQKILNEMQKRTGYSIDGF